MDENTPEHNEKISKSKKGIKQTPEQIAARVAGRAGYKHSEETKAKMRAAKRNIPAESRKKMSDPNLGKVVSAETREKLRQASLGHVLSQEGRDKMSATRAGKILSKATKQRIADSMRKEWEKRKQQSERHELPIIPTDPGVSQEVIDEAIDVREDVLDEIKAKHQIKHSHWCIEEVNDLNDIPFPTARRLSYNHYMMRGLLPGQHPPTICFPVHENSSWLDLWKVADRAIVQSGNPDHCFIEHFEVKGDTVWLITGS